MSDLDTNMHHISSNHTQAFMQRMVLARAEKGKGRREGGRQEREGDGGTHRDTSHQQNSLNNTSNTENRVIVMLLLLLLLTWFAVSKVSTIQVEDGFHVTTSMYQRCFTVEYTSEM